MNNHKNFVNVRGGFSDISGVAPCNTKIQLYEFDKRTRIVISNSVFDLLKNFFEDSRKIFGFKKASSIFCEDVLSKVFVEPVRLSDRESYNWVQVFKSKFDPVFFNASYNEILDLLWYICKWICDRMDNHEMKVMYHLKKQNLCLLVVAPLSII